MTKKQQKKDIVTSTEKKKLESTIDGMLIKFKYEEKEEWKHPIYQYGLLHINKIQTKKQKKEWQLCTLFGEINLGKQEIGN